MDCPGCCWCVHCSVCLHPCEFFVKEESECFYSESDFCSDFESWFSPETDIREDYIL